MLICAVQWWPLLLTVTNFMADFCVFWYSETRLILLDAPVLFWEYFSGDFVPWMSRTSVEIMRVSEH